MKNQFLKSVLILSSVLAFMNCSDESANALDNLDPSADVPTENGTTTANEPCWLLQAGETYLIYPAGIVTDLSGNVVGTIQFTEGTVGNIISADGVTVIIENVNTAVLSETTRELASALIPASSATGAGTDQPATSPASDTPALSSGTTNATSSATGDAPAISSSVEQAPQSSSSEAPQVVTNGKVTMTGNLSQTVAQGASTSEITFTGVSNSESAVRKSWNAYFLITEFDNGTFYIKATNVPPYFQTGSVTETFEIEGVSYELKLNVTASNGQSQPEQKSSSSQQQQQAKSSSSQQQQQPKSSSSQQQQQKSSSSQQQAKSSSSQQQTVTTGCPNIVTKGAGGSGWATRYWDACMPSCSWAENAGGNLARTCAANGKTPTSGGGGSVCSGGSNATCISQIPFTVDGCTEMGFAFAAVPASNGGQCGKCFQLTFTGEGKYSTDKNHKAIKGKKLIIMVTNVGHDVSQGQFDIMIPGGGPGLYNATAGYGWGSQGAQYGGLLSECENESNYRANTYKSCLTEKCNKSFSNDAEAKQGCLFLANFMEAAGNPLHNYVEVECPQVLKSKY